MLLHLFFFEPQNFSRLLGSRHRERATCDRPRKCLACFHHLLGNGANPTRMPPLLGPLRTQTSSAQAPRPGHLSSSDNTSDSFHSCFPRIGVHLQSGPSACFPELTSNMHLVSFVFFPRIGVHLQSGPSACSRSSPPTCIWFLSSSSPLGEQGGLPVLKKQLDHCTRLALQSLIYNPRRCFNFTVRTSCMVTWAKKCQVVQQRRLPWTRVLEVPLDVMLVAEVAQQVAVEVAVAPTAEERRARRRATGGNLSPKGLADCPVT